jgi:subtilisin family serine protease
MAGPHVVGVVALLWSARPALERNIAATRTLLQDTANPNVQVQPAQTCGGTNSDTDIPNNSFGYGLVDALAAYNASGPPPGWQTVSPYPTDEFGGSSTSDGTYSSASARAPRGTSATPPATTRQPTRGRRSHQCPITRR